MKKIFFIFSTLYLNSFAMKFDFFENAKNGNLETIRFNLENKINLINDTDKNSRTALHWAIVRTNIILFKYLINQGININVQDNEGLTPLHLAIRSCLKVYSGESSYFKMIMILLDNKDINVNLKDKSEQTPLDLVRNSDWHNKALKYLLISKLEHLSEDPIKE
ncbi:ankyrin repeat domain-containing protein [Candidatus Dependentiae bacterium]|nr:ankyrin repeat domain-containing protein [Candidatus Dependentiae bacterium]